MRRTLRAAAFIAVLVAALTVALAGSVVTATAADATAPTVAGRRTITGTIDGADFRVELPERWNGTLVLFSHGYWPTDFPPPGGIWLANRPPDRSLTEAWLLDRGYALAASNFLGVTGFQAENALRDQIALLDWFAARVGAPRRTVGYGHSFGAMIATLLAERHPHRFAGVATSCGEFDPNGTWNMALDMLFTVKTLLVPAGEQDIDLVRAREPQRSNDILARTISDAATTPAGRARLALAAAFGDIPGWASAHQPPPTDLVGQVQAQAAWLQAYNFFAGPRERAIDLERRAGGNPSFNAGVNYRRQLARSRQSDLVRQAYRAAPDLDLHRDLDQLESAPRIAPDPNAVAYMYRFAVPSGRIRVPVVTLKTPADGGGVAGHERWYAEQVRRHGDPSDLRHLYVGRGMHCAFSDAEEIVTLRALFERIDTGRWPNLNPHRLNAAAAGFGGPYQLVLDLTTFADAPMPPAFTTFAPARLLRPSG